MAQIKDTTLQEISEVLIHNGFEEGVVNSLQSLLNAVMRLERQEYLGAKPYERTDERTGQGNGFKPKTFHTRVGALELQIPQTRDSKFYPKSLEKGMRSEKSLRLALAEMYLQGVSTRKVMKITEELCGFEISSTEVSRITKSLDEEFQKWRTRRLGQCQYLILDARYEKVRYGGEVLDLAVLWAIGITSEGTRSVLGVSVSLSEAEIHWRNFIKDLLDRGLEGFEYMVSDDHEGLAAARKALLPGIIWQRCQFHLSQNAQNHIGHVENRELVGKDIRNIFNSPNKELAQVALEHFIKKHEKSEPKLVKWAEENIPEGFAVYSRPEDLHKKLRTSNLIERHNKELKRRTKVIGVFPNEASCLRLITAKLMELDEEWMGRRYWKPA
jgi:putative transposase